MQALTHCTSVTLTYRNSITVKVSNKIDIAFRISSEHTINAASSHLFSVYTTLNVSGKQKGIVEKGARKMQGQKMTDQVTGGGKCRTGI